MEYKMESECQKCRQSSVRDVMDTYICYLYVSELEFPSRLDTSELGTPRPTEVRSRQNLAGLLLTVWLC